MKRVLTLLAQTLAVQAAAKAAGAAAATTAVAATGEGGGAVLPLGTGPITTNVLAGVNFRTLSAPPAFVNQLKMPVFTSAEVARFNPAGATATAMLSPTALASARGEVRGTLAQEIRSSGLLKPIAESSRQKYNETFLSEIFATGVLMAFDPTTDGAPTPATGAGGRRLLGWWSDLWDAITGVVEDIGCGAFATGALPGYLASYGLFHAGNSGYSKLNGQQKFFQRAGGFSSDLLNKVNIKYSAWMAPGFGSAGAVTMGSEIYVKGAATTTDTFPTSNLTISSGFKAQTRLLMHEMGHSKQYASRSWSITKFGWDYLFNYCKAGFSYSKNSMEVDAETYRDNSDAIMNGLPTAHFKKWRKSSLESTVGYSKSPAEYTNFKIGGTSVMSLDLTKTVAKLGESQRKGGSACVRVLSGSALSSRTQADITGFPWDCVNVPPTKAPTRKPTTRAPTRKPTTRKPTSPTQKPTFGIIDGPIPKLTPTIKHIPTMKPIVRIPIPIPGPIPEEIIIGRPIRAVP